MIGLDTNVIVRYITQDEPRQSAAATRLMEKVLAPDNPGFVSLITVCEVAWVLAECYDADSGRIRAVVEGLLGTKQIEVESAELVWKALRAWEGSAAGLSDALIAQVAVAGGASKVVTFDKAAAKLPLFELLD
ncbi:MAG TPA: type II toxin-antitoxin system VapC family toxin [Usitatibacter sp.]|nr:type II toxin-antitoxin system VapC family toxin [Usitatibacter sp.]